MMRFILLAAVVACAGCSSPASAQPDRPVEIKINVESGKQTLAGTLICPSMKGGFGCVVLTHGSDPAVRSQYRRLAMRFVDRGIAAFIYDKRGCGDSTGSYVEAPDLAVPAGDLVQCVKRVAAHELIDDQRIGVWGISQGGWAGPLAASQTDAISFVIMVSGPSISPLEQNLFDKGNQLRQHGLSAEEINEITRVRRLVWTYLATGSNEEDAKTAWQTARQAAWFKHLANEPPMGKREVILKHPRMIHFAAHSNYNPEPALKSLNVPVLAVFGEADTIVPAQRCVDTLNRLFAGERSQLLTARIFPDADHGIRVAETGTIKPAEGYWNFVLDWTENQMATAASDPSARK